MLFEHLKLYLIEILHQTTTLRLTSLRAIMLYLIEILHQTTTSTSFPSSSLSCILLKFYIKPQPVQRNPARSISCILLKFYIKPQHNGVKPLAALALYLIEILHQTTTNTLVCPLRSSCILLKFYIKPQHVSSNDKAGVVVSYWNSTSNHNPSASSRSDCSVVSYWNSTSNHNTQAGNHHEHLLYLIEILHQTTTLALFAFPALSCILLKFYIKPQLLLLVVAAGHSCILLKFYIKPQPSAWSSFSRRVVSYWNSTSNHNRVTCPMESSVLYLIEILHQTTTRLYVWTK